jgi:hypothetical protein
MARCSLGLVALALFVSADALPAQDLTVDPAVFDRETAKVKQLGKSAMPVCSKTQGKDGVIAFENGKLACSNGGAMYLAPIGWMTNSSIDLGARVKTYVLVNVGNQAVRVGNDTLNLGEYAIVRDGKLTKVRAKDIK